MARAGQLASRPSVVAALTLEWQRQRGFTVARLHGFCPYSYQYVCMDHRGGRDCVQDWIHGGA